MKAKRKPKEEIKKEYLKKLDRIKRGKFIKFKSVNNLNKYIQSKDT